MRTWRHVPRRANASLDAQVGIRAHLPRQSDSGVASGRGPSSRPGDVMAVTQPAATRLGVTCRDRVRAAPS
jgi:hypothetical protein